VLHLFDVVNFYAAMRMNKGSYKVHNGWEFGDYFRPQERATSGKRDRCRSDIRNLLTLASGWQWLYATWVVSAGQLVRAGDQVPAALRPGARRSCSKPNRQTDGPSDRRTKYNTISIGGGFSSRCSVAMTTHAIV